MSGFVHPEYLVTTDWLAGHLDDPNVVVLDCTTHLIPDPKITYQVKPGRENFEQGHIPGAQFVDMLRDVSDTSHRLRFMRQAPDEFAAAMRRFGVNNSTRVVTYSSANVWWATRLWWLFHEFGYDGAAVLDGGWQKWHREHRPEETGPARTRPPGDFTVREVRNLMVDKDAGTACDRQRRNMHAECVAARAAYRQRRQLWQARPHRRQRQPARGAFAESGDQ